MLLVPYIDKFDQLPEKASFFFHYNAPEVLNDSENLPIIAEQSATSVLRGFVENIVLRVPLSAEIFKEAINRVKSETGVKGKALFHPVRIMLIGSHSGPDFDRVIPLLEYGSMLGLPLHVKNVHERTAEFLTELFIRSGSFGERKDGKVQGDTRLAAESLQPLGWLNFSDLRVLNALSETLYDRGNIQSAAYLQQEIVHRCVDTFGTSHQLTINCLLTFSKILVSFGELGRARYMQQFCLQVAENIELTKERLLAMELLGRTHILGGDLEEAKRLQTEVLEARRRHLGSRHSDTLRSVQNLADVMYKLGEVSLAQDLCNEAWQSRKEILGDSHPDTLTSLSGLAELYRRRGEWAEAERMQMTVLHFREEIFGREHPETCIAAVRLSEIYKTKIVDILRHELLWLTSRPADNLSPIQRDIQKFTRNLLGALSEADKGEFDNNLLVP